MDVSRNDMLGELANDAALERTDFVAQATEQLAKFLDRHRGRVAALGGLTLIDEDPDYLSIAPDMTFRVRSRFEDPDTGEWTTDTEIVETASELVELLRDKGGIGSPGELRPYVSRLPSGLHLLAAPPDPAVMAQMTPELYAELLTFLRRF